MINPNEDMVSEISVTGEDVFQIATKIEPVLEGVPRAHAVVACLALATTLMHPGITPEQLHDAVEGASQWICLFLAGDPTMTEVPKEMLN